MSYNVTNQTESASNQHYIYEDVYWMTSSVENIVSPIHLLLSLSTRTVQDNMSKRIISPKIALMSWGRGGFLCKRELRSDIVVCLRCTWLLQNCSSSYTSSPSVTWLRSQPAVARETTWKSSKHVKDSDSAHHFITSATLVKRPF